MPSIVVTVPSLPYAHRLLGYAGRCAHIHGHNARIEVTVEAAELNAQGFVIDFYLARAAIGRVLNRFDHALVVCERDPLITLLRGAGERVEPFHAPPTAEHLARYVLDAVNAEAAREASPGHPWRATRATWQEEQGFVAVAVVEP